MQKERASLHNILQRMLLLLLLLTASDAADFFV